MALTGIQIFKFLPAAKKTADANCKKCGCATCMAFAMKLAKGDASIDSCPNIDDEFKKVFVQENRKPQIKIEFGNKSRVVIGEENVMFRHDKTFVNPCALAISLKSNDPEFFEKLSQINSYKIDRVGEEFKIDAISLLDCSLDFPQKAKVLLEKDFSLILIAKNYSRLDSFVDLIKDKKPLVYLQSQDIDEMVKLEKLCPIVVDGINPEELAKKTKKLLGLGVQNIVLNLKQDVCLNMLEPLTMIRRSAIENKYEPLGFPVVSFYNSQNDIVLDTINLTTLVCKYSNLIVLDNFNPAILSSIITLRMNIYTDPQKPLQVEPKLYEIGDVGPNSKVMVTTNFALTYFAVVNELENMTEGSYLIITDSDGMSVLTAWSASKFTGEIIAKAVKSSGISDKINHKNIIIPGLVSDLLEEIAEELPEFNFIAGPNEATDLPEFLQKI